MRLKMEFSQVKLPFGRHQEEEEVDTSGGVKERKKHFKTLMDTLMISTSVECE